MVGALCKACIIVYLILECLFFVALRLNGTLSALNLNGILGVSKSHQLPLLGSGENESDDSKQHQHTNNMPIVIHEHMQGWL